MKIIQIDTIVLDYGLWWEEYNDSSKVASVVKPNLNGGSIIFEQPIRQNAVNVTLKSRDDGWQAPTTVALLKALANNSLGQTYTVTDSELNTFDVRFRHEIAEGAVQFVGLFDARTVDWYRGTLYLAKV